MVAVYRPAARSLARASAALFALSLLACDAASAPRAAQPAPSPRPRQFPLATLLDSRSFALIDVDPASGHALLRASDGSELLWSGDRRRPLALPVATGLESLALFPGGGDRLARELAVVSGARERLFRVEPDGRTSVLPIAVGRARLAGRRADGTALDLAGAQEDGSEALYGLATANRVAERIASFPAGFTVSAISPDGGTVALRRTLHPEADEIYVLRRASGEMRLLLPSGEDARFVPLAFDRSAGSLLLVTDERADRSRLEWLDLSSGVRRTLLSAGDSADGGDSACEVIDATLSGDGSRIAATAVCAGRRELRLLDAANGRADALPLLPMLGRAVDGTLGFDGGLSFVTLASPRTPRDLVAYPAGAPDPLPITWGLAPGIDPELLLEPELLRVPSGPGPELPVELWAPDANRPSRDGATATGALLWIEDDRSPPAWSEFEPLFQFLAGRGVVVARFRLRGADGFGRAFRHAADGRLLEAALEDLATVWREVSRGGGGPLRVAIVGEGAWPGAVAAALAFAPPNGRPASLRGLVAVAAIGADDDPFRPLDELAALPEPAKSWWTARLGAPESALAIAARAATRAESRLDLAPALPLLSTGRLDDAALWQFLAPHLDPPGAAR